MIDFVHRVKVFVFDFVERAPSYLLLRGRQGIESFWSPVSAPIGLGEQMEAAIRRSVMQDVGLGRPSELIDLQMPARWVLGDEEIIEWSFGVRVPTRGQEPRLDERFAAFRWAGFGEAYPSLELEPDRAAILRLHTLIAEN